MVTRITNKQIDAILPFLEVLETEKFQFATWKPPTVESGVITFDNNYELTEDANRFVDALYKNGWVVDFDWPSWQDRAIKFVEDPERIASADIQEIRKLLTTHVRKERFCEGHLESMVKNGHIVALLRRLKDLRVELEAPRKTRKGKKNDSQ